MKPFISKLLLVLLTPLLLTAPLHAQCSLGHEAHAEEAEDMLHAECCCSIHHADSPSHVGHGHLAEEFSSGGKLRLAAPPLRLLMTDRFLCAGRTAPVPKVFRSVHYRSFRVRHLSVQLLT